jgi:hypothetical protein
MSRRRGRGAPRHARCRRGTSPRSPIPLRGRSSSTWTEDSSCRSPRVSTTSACARATSTASTARRFRSSPATWPTSKSRSCAGLTWRTTAGTARTITCTSRGPTISLPRGSRAGCRPKTCTSRTCCRWGPFAGSVVRGRTPASERRARSATARRSWRRVRRTRARGFSATVSSSARRTTSTSRAPTWPSVPSGERDATRARSADTRTSAAYRSCATPCSARSTSSRSCSSTASSTPISTAR